MRPYVLGVPGNPVCRWLGLGSCLACCSGGASCPECCQQLGDASSCIQAEGFAELARKCQNADLSVLLFTGYKHEELSTMCDNNVNILLKNTDIIIDGEFVETLFDNKRDWVGSSNQRVIFLSDRYHEGVEFEHGLHSTEIRVSTNGVGINGWPIEIYESGGML